MNQYEEGEPCPVCDGHADGTLEIHSDRGCTCFIVAPCSACVDSTLKCDICGWETDSYGYGDVEADDIKYESQVMEFI